MVNKSKINILDVLINNITKKELENEIEYLLKDHSKIKIFTPNTDIILRASNDEKLKNTLNSADILIADGIGVVYASRILRTPLPERLAGIEIGEYVFSVASKEIYSVFLLGGKQGIAEHAGKRIKEKYPNLNICGTHHGYFDTNGKENDELISRLNELKPDIIFVCMGFPRQEIWISENVNKISSLSLAIGLGGSLDVWAGKLKRAPLIFRKLSLEWLWRILLEPSRIKFILQIPMFFHAILRQKTSKNKKTPNYNG